MPCSRTRHGLTRVGLEPLGQLCKGLLHISMEKVSSKLPVVKESFPFELFSNGVLSSPEPSGSKDKLIVKPSPSSRLLSVRPPFLKIFPTENA